MGSNPMFPTKIKRLDYTYLFTKLNLSFIRKRLFFDFPLKKNFLSLLIFLKKNSLIKAFFKIKPNKYRVYLSHTKNYKFDRKKQLFFKKRSTFNLSFHAIKLLNYNLKNSFLILETQQGLITQKEAFKRKIGGIAIAIYF